MRAVPELEAAPPETPSETKWQWVNRYLDESMAFVETGAVVAIALGAAFVAAYLFLWVVWPGLLGTSQHRLARIGRFLNANWRATLLLVVPLFYRTIRQFMERVVKFAGMEANPPIRGRARHNPAKDPSAEA